MNTAACLHNRSPTSVLKDKTPFKSWFGKKPNISNLKVFGSVVQLHKLNEFITARIVA